VLDYPAVLWATPEEIRHVLEVTSGMLNASQKRMNRAAFSEGVDVQHSGENTAGLIGDDSDAEPAKVREPTNDVGVRALHLVESPGHRRSA
jgi:hypothetical protein